jgi:transcription initiation factor TFIIIB Brf1 subunit/transcription initiation factor TFIIB
MVKNMSIYDCKHKTTVLNSNSEPVCNICGLVLDEDVDMDSSVRYDARTNWATHSVEALGTIIPYDKKFESPKVFKLRTAQRRILTSSYYKKKKYTIFLFKVKDRLNITTPVFNSVMKYISKDIDDKRIINFYHYIFVLTFAFSRLYNTPITYQELYKAIVDLNVSRGFRPGSINIYLNFISQKYPDLSKKLRGISMTKGLLGRILVKITELNKIKKKISRQYNNIEEYKMDVLRKVNELTNTMKIEASGKNPVGFYSSLIYAAERLLARAANRSRILTQEDIETSVGISSLTVRNNFKQIKSKYPLSLF